MRMMCAGYRVLSIKLGAYMYVTYVYAYMCTLLGADQPLAAERSSNF